MSIDRDPPTDPPTPPPVARRRFLAGAGAAAVLGASQLLQPPRRPPGVRHHTLFIFVDDLAELVTNPLVHTPNLERLAAQSLFFTEAHAPVAMCAPSRAASLTGISPDESGLVGHHDAYLGEGCDPCYTDTARRPSVFDKARRQGYRVEGYGRLSHRPKPGEPGWFEREAYGFASRQPWAQATQTDPGAQHVATAWWSAVPGGDGHPDFEMADGVARRIRVLDDRSQRTCLVAAGIVQPHLPWRIPARFFDLYTDQDVQPLIETWSKGRRDLADVPDAGRWERPDRAWAAHTEGREADLVRAYCAAVSFSDAAVGRLLDAVPDHWAVVLVSDHGWMLGEKLTYTKSTAWRSATRVPAMVRIPGVEPEVIDRPVTLLDLPETVLGAMKGKARGWATPRPYVNTWWETTKTVFWRQLHYLHHEDGSGELYHVGRDPDERHNLMAGGRVPDVVHRLRTML